MGLLVGIPIGHSAHVVLTTRVRQNGILPMWCWPMGWDRMSVDQWGEPESFCPCGVDQWGRPELFCPCGMENPRLVLQLVGPRWYETVPLRLQTTGSGCGRTAWWWIVMNCDELCWIVLNCDELFELNIYCHMAMHVHCFDWWHGKIKFLNWLWVVWSKPTSSPTFVLTFFWHHFQVLRMRIDKDFMLMIACEIALSMRRRFALMCGFLLLSALYVTLSCFLA